MDAYSLILCLMQLLIYWSLLVNVNAFSCVTVLRNCKWMHYWFQEYIVWHTRLICRATIEPNLGLKTRIQFFYSMISQNLTKFLFSPPLPPPPKKTKQKKHHPTNQDNKLWCNTKKVHWIYIVKVFIVTVIIDPLGIIRVGWRKFIDRHQLTSL